MPDFGTIIVVVAVLLFYVRIVLLQRSKTLQARREKQAAQASPKKKKGAQPSPGISIVSNKRIDWIIAIVGSVLILFGLVVKANYLSMDFLQPYWWAIVTAGLAGFSQGFK